MQRLFYMIPSLPSRELKGFKRIDIAARDTYEACFDIDFRLMSWFDPKKNQWKIEPVAYKIGIGPNALEQPLEVKFQIKG